MKKPLVLLLIAALLCIPMPEVLAACDTNTTHALLSVLGIITGDPDGNLRLDDPVTRAEFSKIAVAASQYRNAVAQNLTTSPFPDVPYTNWAAPYIQAALEHQLMRGYLDATFRPNAGVLLEEAVTVALRLLGYDETDFGDSWPYGQLGLATNLGLTEGISKQAGDPLTRGDVAALFGHLLYTRPKEGAANERYLSVFDLQLVENTILIASNAQDPGVAEDSVFTSSGSYKIGSLTAEDIGKRGDLLIRSDQSVLLFLPYPQTIETHTVTAVIGADLILDSNAVSGIPEQLPVYFQSQSISYNEAAQYAERGASLTIYRNAADNIEYAVLQNGRADQSNLERYVVYSALGDAVIAYKDGVSEQLRIDEGTTAYDGEQATTYGALQSRLEMGDVLYAKRDGTGKITSVSFEKGSMSGPITIHTAALDTLFDGAAKNAAILRNGQKVSALQAGDIAYYSADLNTILAYDKKVTGIYENALPNKDMPTEIVLSGTTYAIEGLTAFQALSSAGTLQFGDTITLHLGRNGEIADVSAPTETAGQTATGILVQSSSREFTNLDGEKYSAFENIVILPDGTRQTYTSDRSYDDNVNAVVTVTLRDGRVTLNRTGKGVPVSGRVDANAHRIGSKRTASNLQILDVAASGKEADSAYTRTFLQRLEGLDLQSSQVLYCQTNANDEITSLILNNVTGDAGQYGVMIDAENTVSDMYISGSYTYDIGGTTKTEVLSGAALSVNSRQVCQFQFKNSQISRAIPLTELEGPIRQIDETSVRTSKGTYLLAPAAVAYRARYDGTFQLIPFSEAMSEEPANIHAYYDKPQQNGGRIRILIVRE